MPSDTEKSKWLVVWKLVKVCCQGIWGLEKLWELLS
jgi:hypothetical protein